MTPYNYHRVKICLLEHNAVEEPRILVKVVGKKRLSFNVKIKIDFTT